MISMRRLDASDSNQQHESNQNKNPHTDSSEVKLTSVSPLTNVTNQSDILFSERLVTADRLEHKVIYEAYPTTFSLLLLAHLLFLYQWKSRKSRKDVLASYRTLVQQRQYYRGIIAILSHPPVADVNVASSVTDSNSINDAASSSLRLESSAGINHYLFRLWLSSHPRINAFLHPFIHGQLSGVPLLFYNSHLLWSCRALEPSFDSSWDYARVFLGLTVIGVLFELRVTHNMLRGLSLIYHTSLQPADSTAARSLTHTQKTLLHRGMGTLTVLTSGVLILFHSTFPYIPLQAFPFINFTKRFWTPFVSYLCCLCVLTTLSWKSHPVTSVLFGTFSGCLWSSGLVSFLGDAYWGSSLVIIVAMAFILSIKASRPNPSRIDWLPCIDYVAWNHRGRLWLPLSTNASTANPLMTTPILEVPIPHDDESDDDDVDDRNGDDDVESRPLLLPSPTTVRPSIEPITEERSVSTIGEDVLHGRLPIIDMDDDVMDNPASSIVVNSRHVRSRRGVSMFSDSQAERESRFR